MEGGEEREVEGSRGRGGEGGKERLKRVGGERRGGRRRGNGRLRRSGED